MSIITELTMVPAPLRPPPFTTPLSHDALNLRSCASRSAQKKKISTILIRSNLVGSPFRNPLLLLDLPDQIGLGGEPQGASRREDSSRSFRELAPTLNL